MSDSNWRYFNIDVKFACFSIGVQEGVIKLAPPIFDWAKGLTTEAPAFRNWLLRNNALVREFYVNQNQKL